MQDSIEEQDEETANILYSYCQQDFELFSYSNNSLKEFHQSEEIQDDLFDNRQLAYLDHSIYSS